jgi:hypothetical protein
MAAEQPAIEPPTIPTFNGFDMLNPLLRVISDWSRYRLDAGPLCAI